jgi:hypothetical protein
LSINASVQHLASGFGAYLGGAIVSEAADGRIVNFDKVGWIAAGCTLASMWLAARVKIADGYPASAQAMSFAAAAEATADAGESMLGFNEFADR